MGDVSERRPDAAAIPLDDDALDAVAGGAIQTGVTRRPAGSGGTSSSGGSAGSGGGATPFSLVDVLKTPATPVPIPIPFPNL